MRGAVGVGAVVGWGKGVWRLGATAASAATAAHGGDGALRERGIFCHGVSVGLQLARADARAGVGAEIRPDFFPRRVVNAHVQLKHHLRAAHDGGEIVAAERVVAGRENAGRGVEAHQHVSAGAKTVRHGLHGFHAGEDFVAPFRVAGALPFGEPVAGEREPVRAGAHARDIFLVARARRVGLAHRVVGDHGFVGLQRLAHHVARALVGGEVIIKAPERRLPDARLLRAVAPRDDAVPRAEAGHRAEMVGVHLAGLARHRLGQPENVRAARAEKRIPEPRIGSQLGVVPRHAAEVVTPDVARVVEGVHHVAVGPEPIPVALVHLAEVELERGVEAVLDGFFERRRGVAHAPDTERARVVVILRRGDEHRRHRARLRHRGGGWPGGHVARRPEH